MLSVTRMPDWAQHKRILALAVPMILANITTPLLGLVDTAVLGQMGAVHYLAGAAVGAFVLTQLYWICGFLRMTTTGLSAQALGALEELGELGEQSTSPENSRAAQVLANGLYLGLLLGLFLLALQQPIFAVTQAITEPSAQVNIAMRDYFYVRIWGAPFALMNLALLGWLVGQQKAKAVMWLQIAVNLLNIGLNLLFVYGFSWEVKGVALATVITEVSLFMAGLVIALGAVRPSWRISDLSQFSRQLKLNSQMLLRNLALQACLAFVTFTGAKLGAEYAALNAILMQFFVLIALGLDGIAYAIEALVGEAKGAKHANRLSHWVYLGLQWSTAFALVYSLIFAVAGELILQVLTGEQAIQQSFANYWWIVYALPIAGFACFLFDAVFIGLTRAKAMRNSMIISAAIGFFLPFWLIQGLSNESNADAVNQSLWWAMLLFLLFRGATLAGYFDYLRRKDALLD